MSEPSPLLEQIERFERAERQLRETVSEAHSTMKALRLTIQESNKVCLRMEDAIADAAHEHIIEVVEERLADFTRQTIEHADWVQGQITRKFDRILKRVVAAMPTTPADQAAIEDILRKPLRYKRG